MMDDIPSTAKERAELARKLRTKIREIDDEITRMRQVQRGIEYALDLVEGRQ